MQPTKILLVDDIEQNLVALQALLERPGIELLFANSGAQALELLLANPVALALLDVQMPGMDGFELAELMRGSPRTRHVPIIFLTATDRNAMRTFRGYDAGAVDFLYKPFDPHILRSKVEIFVRLYEGQRQLAEQNESLQKALRTTEMFVAVLGHDLRNPLSAMMNLGHVVARAGESERTRSLGARICESGERMSRLVDHMLDLAAMRAGTMVLAPTPLDIRVVCESVIKEIEAGQPQGRIEFTCEGETQGIWDADRLQQVFSNLIGNALQHGTGHAIQVIVSGSAQQVSVRIRNEGSMSPQAAARLFQPFERGEGRGSAHGLGLGLYIAHELVRLHGGTLRMRSEDGSTEFEMNLPRTAEPPKPQDVPARASGR